jgi:hypothetical protein
LEFTPFGKNCQKLIEFKQKRELAGSMTFDPKQPVVCDMAPEKGLGVTHMPSLLIDCHNLPVDIGIMTLYYMPL